MIKQVLAGCSLMAVLAIGSLPVQAQAPAPASPAPAASQGKISSDELQKFSVAVKQLLSIADEAEGQMRQAVRAEGLTESRFNEIHQAKTNPSTKPKNPVTSQEQKQYDQAVVKLAQIQKDANGKMDQAVESQGLPLTRFNQIFEAVQKDPQLRQEVQKLIQK